MQLCQFPRRSGQITHCCNAQPLFPAQLPQAAVCTALQTQSLRCLLSLRTLAATCETEHPGSHQAMHSCTGFVSDDPTSFSLIPFACLLRGSQNFNIIAPHAQVGASNELPESEELDALYDRFLLRRRVEQVTSGALADMLQGSVELAYGGVAPSQVAGSISGVAIAKERFQNVRWPPGQLLHLWPVAAAGHWQHVTCAESGAWQVRGCLCWVPNHELRHAPHCQACLHCPARVHLAAAASAASSAGPHMRMSPRSGGMSAASC